ncbi:MAG TPA: hypothetical protein VE476_15665, partial [Propionibacteriaceae bacterium]|nr:hypothetical protein [Propionibacteriaceae bacterium]
MTDEGMRPEPVEGQDSDASTSAAHIHEESDAEARVKGADPQGESEPDAGTRPEKLTGPEPAVSSADDEAGEQQAETGQAEVAVAEPTAEVLETRTGMFGVRGTGDTSGYGGLTRTIEFPGAATPPFGDWWDSVYARIGELVPNYSDVITKVVIHRGEITFHVNRDHLLEL